MVIRRNLKWIALTCSLLLIVSAFVYASSIVNATEVFRPKTFRFLLSAETDLTVSANTAELNGGAGYILEQKKKAMVVYDCYLSEESAFAARKNLQNKNIPVTIYTRSLETLYLKTQREKKQAKKIVGYLNTLNGCIETLDVLIKGAETGAFSQERLKECLRVTELVLYALQSESCKNCAEFLTKIRSDIVFAKDVRYVKVALCDEYIRFYQQFSL